MSGIVGIIRWDGEQPSAGLVRQMADRIAHRGSDGISFLSKPNVAVGYLHINVTHESFHEEQPIANSQGNILVADARIDNRDELLKLLDLTTQAVNRCIPDSQLILAAYEKWRTNCLDYLIGDFSFVIWEPATQTVFCGRDHSGVRPFYFHHLPGKYFLFASEIKALWAFAPLQKRLDKSRIANYLSHWGQFNIYQHNTFFKTISSLPPAHKLVVNKNQYKEEIYWCIDPKKYQFKSDADYLAAFKNIFEEAVACRIKTPFGVSAFLSGGLDSSSISAVASTLLAQKQRSLDTYYIDTEMEETSEKKYIIPFLKMHAVKHHEVVAQKEYFESLLEIARISDMPEMFSLTYNHFTPILDHVNQNKSRVLLTGSDGDTVVGYGSEYIYEAIKSNNWQEAVKRLNQTHPKEQYISEFGEKEGLKIYSSNMISFFYKKLHEMFGAIKAKWHFLKGIFYYLKVSPYYLIQMIVKRIFSRATEIDDYSVNPNLLKEKVSFMDKNADNHPTTNLLIDRGMLYQMMSEVSEYYDIIGAHHQVQICHPFFDKRLIELCMFMPSKLKFYEGYGRGPLRAAMKEYLPDEILLRKGKIDFTPYIHKQLADLVQNPFKVIEDNRNLLEGYLIANKPKEELLSENKKTNWGRLHHRILYFLHWRKAQEV
ncbi:asparagine synthase-related protein [Persicitalea jodogahamensis]|uniref:asparagine synthase (glutamine-hydrolyzing) n=1 Tax=Persicitalea jodogahamensis TaxID=402147 RepID=A0A8J3D0K5_9BACT|nr:asparagine synthase-related protein [Persicitalea jodogahamensis]GHB58381.1 asparagine synthetase B [Persicitalea jodogahamensis]